MPPTRGAEVGDAGPTVAFMRADYRSLLRQFTGWEANACRHRSGTIQGSRC